MTKNESTQRGRWIIWILVFILLLIVYVTWHGFKSKINDFAPGFQSSQMAQAQHTDRTVRADLGGMSVAIPPHFANYVEYNGDPGWGEKRKGPRPVRTPESKLNSFGFEVRYPDMRGLDSPEMLEDRRNSKLANRQWLTVGVGTGDKFPPTGFLDRRTRRTVGEEALTEYWFNNYGLLPEKEHGLQVFGLKGEDPKDGGPARESDIAKDVFIHRDNTGHVTTFIECSNRKIPAPPCTHTFSMEPFANAYIDVSYRRQMVSQWQQIQEKVRKHILGFAVVREPPDKPGVMVPATPVSSK